jgi:hypothetical protein
VERWTTNIEQFRKIPVTEKTAYRDTYRKHSIDKEAQKLIKEAQAAGKTLSKSDAEKQAEKIVEDTHASHSADFVLGGDVNVFHSMEEGKYNSYVGSVGSRHRAKLEGYSADLKNRIPKEKQSKLHMNFRFIPVIILKP